MADFSFYWYDYETFGVSPGRDRPSQFGGMRTDADFNPLGSPLLLYCKPARDYLPDPEACLLTGITPQLALQKGLPEAEFIARIHQEFSVPGTCVVGYNSMRFDDEFTRHTLYRNLLDPYAREYRNGNSRWDLIDPLRLARALRPEGIEWPLDNDGKPSLRLEWLTQANGIVHDQAHDAVSDVLATLAMARLFRERQPRLFRYLFDQRSKQKAEALLQTGQFVAVIHASEKFAAERHAIAIVVALCRHPSNPNGRVAYDLSVDPTPLLTLSPKELHARLYTPTHQLPEGVERLPLKTVHINKCPVLAPLNTLKPADAARLGIDLNRCQHHLDQLRHSEGLASKIGAILDRGEQKERDGITDPDLMLYSGGFFSNEDKNLLDRLKSLPPTELAGLDLPFEDERLPEMLFRYRARNYPETLTDEERSRFEEYRKRRLNDPAYGASLTVRQYRDKLETLKINCEGDAQAGFVIEQLEQYLSDIQADQAAR
ncbi:MAG: exodeoxyribonuclease I [Methylococcaceae bacterium]